MAYETPLTIAEVMKDISANKYVLPSIQREYVWDTTQIETLFDSLMQDYPIGAFLFWEISKDKLGDYDFYEFLKNYHEKNSVHNKKADLKGADGVTAVLDGQQRLTTVSLLFLAMYNLLKSGIVVAENSQLCEKIYKVYLIDEWQPEDTRIILKPVKSDMTALKRLFEDKSEHIRESNLTVNYDYFYNRIQKNEITIDELYRAIGCLEIIKITLNGDDNPQLIFESLNSTGLDLSEGDKIRNLILMGLSTEKQNAYYERYWNKIEILTKYDVSSFVRDYLSVKNQSIPSLNKVYAVFKEFVEISKADTEDLLKDLLAYAKRYHTLLIGGTGNRIIDGCIYRLNRLETSVIRPFFLEVLRLFDECKLTTDELADIFTITESYLFRRTICDLPTNSLNKTFLMLHKEILRYDGTENAYVDKLKYALLSKKERVRFPDDEEFGRSFTERQIYLMQSKNKIYILERLENSGTAEDKDVYRHFDEGDYSIEHIMPQHLTPAWIEELGEDYEQIHETWLHRIANLTLTAYNSNYSNNTFADKKNMKNGFVDSGIRMNTYISHKEHWTLIELEERSDHLKNRALTIWKLPDTGYQPAEKELDFFTLADDTEQPVSSWVDMLQRVLQILYDEDKSILIQLGVSNENGVAQFFSFNENSFRKAVEISEGLYVYTNTNTSSKLNLLEKLFGMYNIDLTELGFYLRNTADELENESGTRYEIRRKYWSYALPKIKEVNAENGAFSNVDFSKENWINGYIGIAGFNICCVANYDSARVEMVFSKADKAVNKETFDKLKQYKAEVEKALRSQIVWQRGEDQKSSKVFVQLDGVSIAEENDWLRMSDFHAEWSKKFFNILVPYIKN